MNTNKDLVIDRRKSSKNSKNKSGGTLMKVSIKCKHYIAVIVYNPLVMPQDSFFIFLSNIGIIKTLKMLLAITLWAPRHILKPLFGGKKSSKSRPKQRAADAAPTEAPTSDPVLKQEVLDEIALVDKAAKYQAIKDTISTGNLILERVNGSPLSSASASDEIRVAPMPSPVEVRIPTPKIPDADLSSEVVAAVPSPALSSPSKPPAVPMPQPTGTSIVTSTSSAPAASPEKAGVVSAAAPIPEPTTVMATAESNTIPAMAPLSPSPFPAVVEPTSSTALVTTQKDEIDYTVLSLGVQLNVLVLAVVGVAVSCAAFTFL